MQQDLSNSQSILALRASNKTMCAVMALAIRSVVRGCYIYKEVWSTKIDSELPCSPEYGNHEDWYDITHMLLKPSRDCSKF